MAEDDCSDAQFEEELLEFKKRLSQKFDQLGAKIEDRMSGISDRICEKMDKIGGKMDKISDRMDECIALLHQALRDQGLMVPPKSTSVPATVASPPLEPLRSTTRVDLGSKLVLQLSPFPSFAVKDDDLQREVQEEQLPTPYVAKRELERPIRHLEVHPKDHAVKLGEIPILNLQEFSEQSVLGGFELSDNSSNCSLLSLGVHQLYDSSCKFNGVIGDTNNAHKLFDEMPRQNLELVFVVKTIRSWVLEDASFPKFCVHFGMFDTIAFDPGGRIADKREIQVLNWGGGNQNRLPAECDGFLLEFEHLGKLTLSCERGVEVNACNMFDELLEAAIKIFTESVEFMQQLEPFVFIVFNPRGAYVWLKCGNGSDYLPRFPIHWDPKGGLLVVQITAALGIMDDQLMKFKISYYNWEEDPCAFDPGGKADRFDESRFLSMIPIH